MFRNIEVCKPIFSTPNLVINRKFNAKYFQCHHSCFQKLVNIAKTFLHLISFIEKIFFKNIYKCRLSYVYNCLPYYIYKYFFIFISIYFLMFTNFYFLTFSSVNFRNAFFLCLQVSTYVHK